MADPTAFQSPFVQEPEAYSALNLAARFREEPGDLEPFLNGLFDHIERVQPNVNALTSLQRDAAHARARRLAARGPQPGESLYGVPVVIKENIQKKGFPVECASRILKGYTGQFDATAVTLMESAGAILIGTANMDEFAMGSSNESSRHGPVRNPHDLARVSGGSSGGSAVACALGFAPLCLGSDTGGSVRQPAAYCGIFGFKPSYGRVSRYGLVAYGSSFDQISPFARTLDDLDALMTVLGVPDPRDATSLPTRYVSAGVNEGLEGKKVGVLRKLLVRGVDAPVLEALAHLEDLLRAQGAVVVDIDVAGLEHSLSAYYLTACAEASSNLARFDGVRFGARANEPADLGDLYRRSRSEGFGDEVKMRILLGTFALSAGYYDAYYGKAQAARRLIAQEFARAFAEVDVILTPTAPTCAFKFGDHAKDPVQMYLNDIFTIPANLAGLCALSLPAAGKAADPGSPHLAGLPVGLQLMAARGQDAALLAFGRVMEKRGLTRVHPLT